MRAVIRALSESSVSADDCDGVCEADALPAAVAKDKEIASNQTSVVRKKKRLYFESIAIY